MTNPSSKVLALGNTDNVLIAITDLGKDIELAEYKISLAQDITAGHKIALTNIANGEAIRKCNQIIGIADKDIRAGEHVHTHNTRQYTAITDENLVETKKSPIIASDMTFDGFPRPDGRFGTRNYIGILSTVNCSATVSRHIADVFRQPGALADYPNVDGVAAFTHESGCAMDTGGEGHQILQRVIHGYAQHPNIGGILLIGLGCETNQAGIYAKDIDKPFHIFNIQDTGGTRSTIEKGISLVKKMLPEVNEIRRSPAAVKYLSTGLQCGGSDAFSVITANPALGVAADMLVEHGATVILSETPEVANGADMLFKRALDHSVAEKIRIRLQWWKEYAKTHGTVIENNPSPGNKAGGITTLAEKALGAIAKSGNSPLVEVYQYAEPITGQGLVFMDSPGYDPVSVTGQIASGANIICFTTGRGSVFGSKPSPCLKLASNSTLYQRMGDDMDINCGDIIDGSATIQEKGKEIFSLILKTASGEVTKSEALDIGNNEFAPWILGAVL